LAVSEIRSKVATRESRKNHERIFRGGRRVDFSKYRVVEDRLRNKTVIRVVNNCE
jgi:hypothetical protein